MANNNKKNVLYLGLNSPSTEFVHYPIIQIVPRSPTSSDISDCFKNLKTFSHIIFSSQNSVRITLDFTKNFEHDKAIFEDKTLICVGKKTASCLNSYGLTPTVIAEEETSEGIVEELKNLQFPTTPWFFWPHSALSRSVIKNFLIDSGFFFKECILYDTLPHKKEPLPDLSKIDEVIFTSPSCIDAFIEIFGKLPLDKILTCIGPVTENYLRTKN